jgi:hypothetical protein
MLLLNMRFGVRDELVVVLAPHGLAARTVDLLGHAVLPSFRPFYLERPIAKHGEA